ncbi:hypothetical protein AB0M79_35055 [Polymorphospora sp. NPDC051019]|uniref:hypothetical protein n=1 Tax=Polymorphospora sp. NPDC051019 TaxID=3155725 RepID=UPI003422456A
MSAVPVLVVLSEEPVEFASAGELAAVGEILAAVEWFERSPICLIRGPGEMSETGCRSW